MLDRMPTLNLSVAAQVDALSLSPKTATSPTLTPPEWASLVQAASISVSVALAPYLQRARRSTVMYVYLLFTNSYESLKMTNCPVAMNFSSRDSSSTCSATASPKLPLLMPRSSPSAWHHILTCSPHPPHRQLIHSSLLSPPSLVLHAYSH